jgi:hypothetical protein
MGPLIYHLVEVAKEFDCIDPWSTAPSLGDYFPWDESTRRQGPQLCHRSAVAGEDEGPSSLHFTKYLGSTWLGRIFQISGQRLYRLFL